MKKDGLKVTLSITVPALTSNPNVPNRFLQSKIDSQLSFRPDVPLGLEISVLLLSCDETDGLNITSA